MSQRGAILTNFGTLLNGAGKPAAVPAAVRARDKSITAKDDTPAITFYAAVDTIQPTHGKGEGAPARTDPLKPVRRQLDIAVECAAKAGTGTTPDEELDAMTSWVVKATCGADWGTIAQGASEVQTEFDYDTAEVPVAIALVTIRVYYTSRAGDPDVRV